MSKRDCASGAEGKRAAEKKRKVPPWPPVEEENKFLYIFTGLEQVEYNVEVCALLRAGR